MGPCHAFGTTGPERIQTNRLECGQQPWQWHARLRHKKRLTVRARLQRYPARTCNTRNISFPARLKDGTSQDEIFDLFWSQVEATRASAPLIAVAASVIRRVARSVLCGFTQCRAN